MNSAFKLMSLVIAGALIAACSTYHSETSNPREQRERDAKFSVDQFKETDPSLSRFFKNAAGYAVFPAVTKGAIAIGGAHGGGVVYDKAGHVTGYATLNQGTIGAQLGGQVYSELIFFQSDRELAKFKAGEMEFAAQASAVAASKGAAANADYAHGVAVFTAGEKGLMFEASVGGQKFSYSPKN